MVHRSGSLRVPFALAAVFGTCLGGARSAWADDLQFTLGVKAWANEWSSWDPVSTGNNTIRVIESVAANTHYSYIPQAGARHGNFLVQASYFTSSTYSLGGLVNPVSGQLGALSATRRELDGNFGYYVLPSLAVTIGYKQIEQEFGTFHYKWKGPIVGVAGSASLRGALATYGTFAYGRLKLDASVPDDAGNTSFNADYVLTEAGLAYSVNTPLSRLGFTVTLGYRAQLVSTRRFEESTGFDGYRPVDLHDFTYGPALTLLSRF